MSGWIANQDQQLSWPHFKSVPIFDGVCFESSRHLSPDTLPFSTFTFSSNSCKLGLPQIRTMLEEKIATASTLPENISRGALPIKPGQDNPLRDISHDDSSRSASDDPTSSSSESKPPRGARFWIIIAGLIFSVIISSLDGSALSTALPTIVSELDIGPDYVWTTNIYFLTQTIVQPLLGQLSDLFGRRWILISSICMFMLGSGLLGGASSGTMFIVGRGVQGLGAGGINMMTDMIVCDLVPLRDRSAFMGLIFGVGAGTASVMGPLIAGALTDAGAWRWLFYLNLPLGAISVGVMVIWLRVGHRHKGSGASWRLKQVDWAGTLILTGSVVAILYSLANGDAVKPWSDGAIIAGLASGFVGLILFVLWQAAPQCRNPLMPLRLFRNRTSAAGLFLSVTNSIMIFWAVYMFPVYLQAVLGAGPRQSGIWLLPLILGFPVGSVISGVATQKLGRYKPLHVVGFSLSAISFGLCSILDKNTHMAVWVVFQLILSLGISLPVACLLPCVQAPLSDDDTATSTGTWAFLRSFGSIWGFAIPAAVFNDRFAKLDYIIEDEATRQALSGGKAYAHAAASPLADLSSTSLVQNQVLQVYTMSLQRVWQIGVIFAGISVLVSLTERELPMREALKTDFGLKAESNSEKGENNTKDGPEKRQQRQGSKSHSNEAL
ncbi:efflux pump FUS6 [Rhypophila decipiens]